MFKGMEARIKEEKSNIRGQAEQRGMHFLWRPIDTSRFLLSEYKL